MNKDTITLVETDAGHFYKIEGEEYQEDTYLPSSTTILNCFPNPGLDVWLQNSTPEEIKKAQDEGKRQGSKVHKIIELRIAGQTVLGSGLSEDQISKVGISDKKLTNYLREPLTKREEDALVGAENFWEEFKPITVQTELMIFSKKYGYAGTLDWVGYLWNKKTNKYDLWIVDWKISKTLDRGYDLQLASYIQALEETYKKKFPKIRLGILQLGKNKCKYSFKEIKDRKKAFDIFLNTKKIYDDLNPNSKPKITRRREQFDSLPTYKKKGKLLKL